MSNVVSFYARESRGNGKKGGWLADWNGLIDRVLPAAAAEFSTGGHLWFYILRSKISLEIVSTIFTSTVFCSTLILLFRIVSTVFGSADISST